MIKRIWMKYKYLVKPIIIIFFFWIIIITVNIGFNRYNDNLQIKELETEINKLIEDIMELNNKSKTIEDDIVLKSIMKLQPKLDMEVAIDITAAIIDNCMKKELSPYLVVCLIFVESGFNQMATSGKMAIGLMQVHWASWNGNELCARAKTINDLYQIDINIDCGTSILKKMITDGGDIKKGLNSYYGVESQKYHNKMASALYKIMFNN